MIPACTTYQRLGDGDCRCASCLELHEREEGTDRCENRGGPCSEDGARCDCVAVAEVRGAHDEPGTGERMCGACAVYNVATLADMFAEWDA